MLHVPVLNGYSDCCRRDVRRFVPHRYRYRYRLVRSVAKKGVPVPVYVGVDVIESDQLLYCATTRNATFNISTRRLFDPLVLTLLLVAPSWSALTVNMKPKKARFITNSKCPFAQKAWIALECSQVTYELVKISLYGTNGKPDWFWKVNPVGTVPVFVCEDGTVLPDSDSILDMHERSGTIQNSASLCDPAVVQQVSEWRAFINEKLLPIGKKAVQGSVKEPLWKLLR